MDGQSARLTAVHLSLDGKNLRISGEDIRETWRVRSLRIWSEGGDSPLIIGQRRRDARIMIAPEDRAALTRWLPGLLDGRRRRRGTWMLGSSLTAMAASLVGFMFIGLPALSGPLAEQVPLEVETRLGERSNAFVGMFSHECEASEEARTALAALSAAFGEVSGSEFELDMRVIDADFPNAFAMPGGQIVITDELIELMRSPEELAGVLAHESAHVAQRHVMAAQLREMGFGMMLDFLLGGSTGAGQELARAGASLESLRHSRDAELEADELALAYLDELDFDPQGLASFFETLNAYIETQAAASHETSSGENTAGDDETTTPQSSNKAAETWLDAVLSTHPDTRGRADRARTAAQTLSWSGQPVMSETAWLAVRDVCRAEAEARAETSANVIERIGEILTPTDDKTSE